jgi:hypothetical protein
MVMVSVVPLMPALVTEVLTKSMASPTCQLEIVPVRPDGLCRSSVADAPPNVTFCAVPPADTYSVPPLSTVVLLAVPPLSTTSEPVKTVTPLAVP